MHERAALHSGEDGTVERGGVFLAAEDEACARPRECLVGRRRDEVGVLDRVRVQPRGDKPGEVRHVAHQQRADLVGDPPELQRFDGPRVGRPAADDQPRPVLLRQREHLVVVDDVRLAGDAVVDDGVEPAGEVDLQPVREMAAVVEPKREDRVARLQHGEVDGHVRLRAGVRLNVRVLGPEELLRAVDRELLDLVDDLAASVVAAPGYPSAYLFVGTLPTASSTAGQVKFSDAISSIWPRCRSSSLPEQRRDLGVAVGEPGTAQRGERLGGDGHRRTPGIAV